MCHHIIDHPAESERERHGRHVSLTVWVAFAGIVNTMASGDNRTPFPISFVSSRMDTILWQSALVAPILLPPVAIAPAAFSAATALFAMDSTVSCDAQSAIWAVNRVYMLCDFTALLCSSNLRESGKNYIDGRKMWPICCVFVCERSYFLVMVVYSATNMCVCCLKAVAEKKPFNPIDMTCILYHSPQTQRWTAWMPSERTSVCVRVTAAERKRATTRTGARSMKAETWATAKWYAEKSAYAQARTKQCRRNFAGDSKRNGENSLNCAALHGVLVYRIIRV